MIDKSSKLLLGNFLSINSWIYQLIVLALVLRVYF